MMTQARSVARHTPPRWSSGAQTISSDETQNTPVLLVDDHPANLLALSAILEPLGLALVTASSGEEALMQVLRRNFAVILMDVQMPGLDGFSTTAMIKQRERSRHIPIIFLTAISRDAEHVFQGYAHGAVDYLLKPFDPEILRSKVRVFVDLYRQQQTIARQERELRAREREALERKNEARFRELTDALPSIVWGVEPNGEVSYGNREWRAYESGERTEPANVLRLEDAHPDDTESVRLAWQQALESGRPFEWQFRLKRPNQSDHRWHLGRAVPEARDANTATRWIATVTDIDDRKRAEAFLSFASSASTKLAQSLSLDDLVQVVLDLIVPDLATMCIVQCDSDPVAGRFAACRDQQSREELVLRALQHHAEEGSESEVAFWAAETKLYEDTDALHQLATTPESRAALGELSISSCIVIPLLGRGGVIGAVLSARDNERPSFTRDETLLLEELARRAAMALENARLFSEAQRDRQVAEEASRIKDQFLAIVSHELRTPLNAILGWSQAVIEGKISPDKHERALQAIHRSAVHQNQLVEDLLDVSRITAGQLRLEVAEIDPRTAVEAAVEVVRPAAAAKKIGLSVELEGDTGPVLADSNRLQQVVWNVVANAIKFTPSGGNVEVRLSRAGDMVTISVRDEGEGIAPAFLPHVFERFRQADSASTRVHSGLGLGLAIAKNLIELHGGTIRACSEGLEKGATFFISLPSAKPRASTTEG